MRRGIWSNVFRGEGKTATIGHIQRKDSAGRVLLANFIGHQVIAGVSKSFYQYKQDQLPYLPDNTKWRFMWDFTQEYKINANIYE